MKPSYAYYPGCLASLSQKELDTSTRAIAEKMGAELVEIPGFTCCGAGDVHEARPEYYLHLNARILGQAEQLGQETLLTICNVCTLNLRQADLKLKADAELRERVNKNLARRRRRLLRGRRRGAASALGDRRGRGLREAEADRPEAAHGRQDRAVLRLPDPAPVEDARVRGSRPAAVARADHRGVRGGAGRLPVQDQVLRLPDRPGPRGGRARRAHPAARGGQGGGRRRDGDAVPALPPLARRVAGEGQPRGRHGVRPADLPPGPARRARPPASRTTTCSSSATSRRPTRRRTRSTRRATSGVRSPNPAVACA